MNANDSNIAIFNWNVRGLNSAVRREEVRKMLQAVKPSIACLQETKLQVIDDSLASDFLGSGLPSYTYLPAAGVCGGIALAWDLDFVTVSDVSLKAYSLTARITMRLSNISYMLTTVYGPSQDSENPAFIAELKDLKPPQDIPWLCLGDFNLIYSAQDKNNLNLNRRLMRLFRHALDHCELLEIALQNRKFTWSSERNNPTLVRLDRVFCNKEWDLSFPAIHLQALSSSASDHCPLFLSQIRQEPLPATFKFEQFWTRVPGFLDVVKTAWEAPVTGISALNILHHKLCNTAKALKNWSSNLFGDAQMQFHMA